MKNNKKLNTILLGFCVLASSLFTTSCLNGSSSPMITVQGMWIDTTAIQTTQTPIEVGDTLRMYLGLHGYTHQLKYVKINVDREYFKDSLFSTQFVDSFCTTGTQPENGHYVFKPGYSDFYVMWHLIPKKARENQDTPFDVQMIIENDTKVDNEFNPNSLSFHVLVSDSTAKK